MRVSQYTIMVKTVPTNDDSLLSGIQQGQTLGVTEMASSEPGKEDEIYVAGLFNRLLSIPKTKSNIKSALKTDEVQEEIVTSVQGETKINEAGEEFFDAQINVDFNKINNINDFSRVIDEYTSATPNPEKLEFKDEFKALATDLQIKPILLQGSGFKSAKEVYAARQFIKDSGTYLLNLADEVIKNPTNSETLLKFKKHLVTHGLYVTQFKKGRANVGQALAAFRIPTMADPKNQANALDAIIAEQGGSANIVDIAQKTKKLVDANGDIASLNKFVGDNWMKKSGRAWSEAYRGGLLFSPKTQLRNILGNGAYLAYTIPEYTLAGIYGTLDNTRIGITNLVRGRHWGDGQSGLTWELGVARLYGLINGFGDAFKVANKSVRTGQASDGATKYEGANQEYITAKNLGLEDSSFGSAVDMMGKLYRLPYLGLTYGDEFFKEIARSMEMHTLIMTEATRIANTTGKSFKEAMTDAVNDVASRPEEFTKQLDEAARYYTFQDQLPGNLEKFTKAIQDTPYIGTIILPFAKTPVNVVRRFGDISGLGVFDVSRMKNDPIYRNRTLAKLTMASGAVMYTAQLYSQGRITGGYPTLSNGRIDPKMKAALDAKGWRPYSLVFAADDLPEGTPLYDEDGLPTGDHIYISYNGLEPISAVFGVTAHAMELMHRSNDPKVRDDLGMALPLAMLQYMNEMPMIQGLSDIFTAMSSFNLNDVAKDALSAWITAPTLPLAPVKGTGYLLGGETNEEGEFNIYKRNLDRDFERDLRPYLDDGTANLNYGQPLDSTFKNPLIDTYNQYLYQMPYDDFVGSIGNQVFGKSKTGNDLPPATDIFGYPIDRSSEMGLMSDIYNTYFGVFGIKKVKDKGLHYHENERLGGVITYLPKQIKGIALRPQEYYDYVQFSLQTPDEDFEGYSFAKYMELYMGSDLYKNLTNNEKAQEVQNLKIKAMENGQELLIAAYPEIGEAIIERQNLLELDVLQKPGVNLLQ